MYTCFIDNRFILKQMSLREVQSFNEFAPHYFKYVTKSSMDSVNLSRFNIWKSNTNWLVISMNKVRHQCQFVSCRDPWRLPRFSACSKSCIRIRKQQPLSSRIFLSWKTYFTIGKSVRWSCNIWIEVVLIIDRLEPWCPCSHACVGLQLK